MAVDVAEDEALGLSVCDSGVDVTDAEAVEVDVRGDLVGLASSDTSST